MKEIAIIFFTPITVVTLIFFLGLVSSRPKNKIKIYFYSLLFLMIFSMPISSFILSFPLINLVKTINENNQNNIKSVIVLTAGIEKDLSENWRPSSNSVNRTLLGKSYSDKLFVPLVISGGLTGSQILSEAAVIRDYLKLSNSIIEQNSKNTYESAKNLESFCKQEKGPFLLITGDYHRLRSYLSFKSHNCDVKLIPKKVNFNMLLFYPSSDGIKVFEKLTYEYMGIFYYLITNKIKPLVLFNI
ncbi:MAG: hypothetical protein CMJ08_02135 [Pelagibacterales bacterium]|nr:hypothetical protein [Pelagibacterales bacterium]